MTHPLGSADITISLPEITKFCYINKYRFRFHLEFILIKIDLISMMSAKLATLGLLKIKLF